MIIRMLIQGAILVNLIKILFLPIVDENSPKQLKKSEILAKIFNTNYAIQHRIMPMMKSNTQDKRKYEYVNQHKDKSKISDRYNTRNQNQLKISRSGEPSKLTYQIDFAFVDNQRKNEKVKLLNKLNLKLKNEKFRNQVNSK